MPETTGDTHRLACPVCGDPRGLNDMWDGWDDMTDGAEIEMECTVCEVACRVSCSIDITLTARPAVEEASDA